MLAAQLRRWVASFSVVATRGTTMADADSGTMRGGGGVKMQ